YTDTDFQVERHSHHAGRALSLKETLLRRSEARAQADLLRETQQHLHRSQYDCEAADRAGKYLKAGLDVWGFAAWQIRHFPMVSYKRSEEHTSELQSRFDLVCRLLLEKKKKKQKNNYTYMHNSTKSTSQQLKPHTITRSSHSLI